MALCDYFAASIPEPWQILGVQLKPFSLGHYLKLRRLDNAFVADAPANATLGDLVLGVIVCSMPSDPNPEVDPFWRWLNRPAKFNALAFLFRKQPMTPAELDVYRFGRRVGQFDFAEKAKLFADYIRAHSSEPGYWKLKTDDGENPQGAHWSHAVLSVLTSECGYSQAEALNAPLCKAFQDYYQHAETNGIVRLMTPDELAQAQAEQ